MHKLTLTREGLLGEYADPKEEAHKYAAQCVMDGYRVNIRPHPPIFGAFEVTAKGLKGRIFAPLAGVTK